MLIKSKTFEGYKNITILTDDESGIFAVEITKPSKVELPKITHGYGWERDCEDFTISIKKPVPQKVLRTVIVRRTSTNNYTCTYADARGVEFATAKTLDELHDFLRPLWERSV